MEFHDNEKHNRFCKVRVSERMCHAQAGIWIVEILLLLGKVLCFQKQKCFYILNPVLIRVNLHVCTFCNIRHVLQRTNRIKTQMSFKPNNYIFILHRKFCLTSSTNNEQMFLQQFMVVKIDIQYSQQTTVVCLCETTFNQ